MNFIDELCGNLLYFLVLIVGTLQVFSTMLATKEDVDTGWTLLDVGKLTNSFDDILTCVCNAIKALVDLFEKGLDVTYHILGYKWTKIQSGVVQSQPEEGYTPNPKIPACVFNESIDVLCVTTLQSNEEDLVSSPTLNSQQEQLAPS